MRRGESARGTGKAGAEDDDVGFGGLAGGGLVLFGGCCTSCEHGGCAEYGESAAERATTYGHAGGIHEIPSLFTQAPPRAFERADLAAHSIPPS